MSTNEPDHLHKSKLRQHLLILRCQVGEVSAFRELYAMFAGRTLRFLKSFVSAPVAEDLNQELWLNVYRRIASLTNADGFMTWLFQAARNKALDYLRSTNRFDAFYETFKAEAEPPVTKATFELPESEMNGYLKEGLEHLSNTHREVLVLHFLEGMDYEEIALISGCSLGTVKSRAHNAKLKLKNFINTKISKQ
ncbi:MAG: RNA polymerase sigma factor [Roseivirga sp.]|nr:RNA polymerase sigma factor [Roseivirga sp.]